MNTAKRTELSYARRIAKVTEHIEAHLDSPLELESLAAVAHFSPWHFHRVYRTMMGETLGDSVRRLRLHRAAGELLGGERPLEQIAKRAGYGSLAAFSRAFVAVYETPPGRYRRGGKLVTDDEAAPRDNGATYEVEIGSFPGVRLAAIEHRGDYDKIGGAFGRAFAWAATRGVLSAPPRSFGIYYADAPSVPEASLRAHAGVAVTSNAVADGEVEIVEIPPLLCASVVHQGPYAELELPYRFLYRDWLAEGGREPADYPCFEEYLNDARELPPTEWLTRIHLPLER